LEALGIDGRITLKRMFME